MALDILRDSGEDSSSLRSSVLAECLELHLNYMRDTVANHERDAHIRQCVYGASPVGSIGEHKLSRRTVKASRSGEFRRLAEEGKITYREAAALEQLVLEKISEYSWFDKLNYHINYSGIVSEMLLSGKQHVMNAALIGASLASIAVSPSSSALFALAAAAHMIRIDKWLMHILFGPKTEEDARHVDEYRDLENARRFLKMIKAQTWQSEKKRRDAPSRNPVYSGALIHKHQAH